MNHVTFGTTSESQIKFSLKTNQICERIMLTIIDRFQGGPIGLDTLATAVCEEKNTLEDVYEPF